MVKTRGLAEAKVRVGDIEKIVSKLLKKKKKIRIFESGCGYGKVMMELSKKFGSQVEIVGMNLKKGHGDKEKMISFALSEGIVTKDELNKMKIPKIIFGDAGEKIPFKTDSIDLVYSQVSIYLYKDKAHFLEEVARVLTKDGIGITTYPGNGELAEEFKELFVIYNQGKKISLKEYFKKFKGIRLYINKKGGTPIEIKSGKLKLGLELEATINVNNLNKKWFGIQSIYHTK